MSARSADTWLDLFKTTERELEMIVVAAKGVKKGGTASVKEKRLTTRRLEECGTVVSRLSSLLESLEGDATQPVGMGELQRRRGLLANLKRILGQGVICFKSQRKPRSRVRKEMWSFFQLMNKNWQDRSQSDNKQDKTLDLIDDGVQRLKAMSHDLHSELDLHINLLQDLDESVEASNRRMLSTARRVEEFTDSGSDNNCCAVVTMAALCGIMVLLAITDVACLLKPCR